MIRVVLTRGAEDDLGAIWRRIAQEDERAADRILMVGDKLDLLALHPRIGPRRPDIRESARFLVEGHCLVHETHPDTDDGPVDWIEVVGIVDGRRDLANWF